MSDLNESMRPQAAVPKGLALGIITYTGMVYKAMFERRELSFRRLTFCRFSLYFENPSLGPRIHLHKVQGEKEDKQR
jgi:hypothetical protein